MIDQNQIFIDQGLCMNTIFSICSFRMSFFNLLTLIFMLGCRSKHSQIKRTRPGCVGSGEDPHKITSSRWNYAISLQVSTRQYSIQGYYRPMFISALLHLQMVLPRLEFTQTLEFMTNTLSK